ncbi:MAG TPA: DUF1269 domain-containing protein [Burkholderiales bacterium]|jgi:hypothetical protein|nr:DUF1269 domain-containing protein [Burkholderiales bacterium]
MRRRLYFVLPDLPSAEQAVRDLLLARIEFRRIHCLAKRGVSLGELPEAGVLQKTDLVHGAEMGIGLGGLAGVVLAALAMLFSAEARQLSLAFILVAGLGGAVFGAWVAAMVGAGVPNSKLRPFQSALDSGQILLMVDVPFTRADEIRELIARRHPEAVPGGIEPTIPAFP